MLAAGSTAFTPSWGRRLALMPCPLFRFLFERGPPHKLFTDNDMAFCSWEFRVFANDWGVNLQFHCVYIAAGIAERCHCTVKRIAARMHCLIQEAVYWHNVTPRDNMSPPTKPANKIYHYEVSVKGVDAPITSSGPGHNYYQVRNRVWFKMVQNRCTTKFGKGLVTKVISPQSVLVDGIPRHMKICTPTQRDIDGGRLWWHTFWEWGRKPTV